MDLTAFLKARLDEDEAYLRELTEIGERKRDAMSEADFAANMPAFQELMTDRAILDLHEPDEWGCQRCEETSNPCQTLRHLAAVYSGHPDYDPAWAV